MASFRRLALVLMAMLARPWVWLMLGIWLTGPGQLLLTAVLTRSETLTPVAVVPGPTVPPNGGADVRESHLATITDWYALWTPSVRMSADENRTLVESDRDRNERLGHWDILDRLPAVERLWLTAPDGLSKEGWRRIGDHKRLELLSLTHVHVGGDSVVGDGSFARAGGDALARLTRLTHLELRSTGTGPERGILLPPLPSLETCSIEWIRLEENLVTLCDCLASSRKGIGKPNSRSASVVSRPDGGHLRLMYPTTTAAGGSPTSRSTGNWLGRSRQRPRLQLGFRTCFGGRSRSCRFRCSSAS